MAAEGGGASNSNNEYCKIFINCGSLLAYVIIRVIHTGTE